MGARGSGIVVVATRNGGFIIVAVDEMGLVQLILNAAPGGTKICPGSNIATGISDVTVGSYAL